MQLATNKILMLTKEKIELIENQAKETLKSSYGTEPIVPPIDLNKVLKIYGLALKKGQFTDPKISGFYKKSEPAIYIAEDESYTRQVFTVAHEIGHFLLHADKQEDTFLRSQFTLLDAEEKDTEREANWFAASLLMPKELVERFWLVTKNIEQMARIFGVSYTAMRWRLKNLHLIENGV